MGACLAHQQLKWNMICFRYEEVVTDLLQYSLVCLDKKYYLTPDSKFKLIRLLPTLLIILDKRPPTKETKVFINSLLKARKVKFEQVTLFQKLHYYD